MFDEFKFFEFIYYEYIFSVFTNCNLKETDSVFFFRMEWLSRSLSDDGTCMNINIFPLHYSCVELSPHFGESSHHILYSQDGNLSNFTLSPKRVPAVIPLINMFKTVK